MRLVFRLKHEVESDNVEIVLLPVTVDREAIFHNILVWRHSFRGACFIRKR